MGRNIITAILLIALGFASCDDFLETDDKNNSVESNFFSTKAECEQALWGCYNVLQANNLDNILLVAESMSDNSYIGAGTDGDLGWDEFRDAGEQNMFKGAWEKYNWGIHRCNFLLENLPNAPISDEDRISLEAEVKFLRAYFYFDFVRLFGNVPLNTTSDGEDLAQADPKLVYELIAKDLVFASENLKSSYSAEWYGRATSWAAKSLLARAYLFYTGYYQANDLAGVVTGDKMRTYIQQVIEEGPFSLLEDYRSLWPYSQLTYWTGEAEDIFAGESNQEIVFSIKYTEEGTSESFLSGAFDNVNLATGNTWVLYLGPRSAGSDVIGAFHYGWGFLPVTPKLFNAFDTKDRRRDASIVDLEVKDGYSGADNQRDYTGLWQQKYQPLVDEDGVPLAGNSGSAWQYGQGQDYYIIRFADVLLMGAELFLTEDNAKAQKYFNDVRKRAFGADYVEKPVSIDAIFSERQFELAFEGIRYFDLLRYDGQNNLNYAKTNIDATSGQVITSHEVVEKQVSFRKETKGLLQIPYEQINLSTKLKQNPGWEF